MKLVNSDDRPTAVNADDLAIHTSRENGDFAECPRTWTLREAVEQRGGKRVRVLCIEGIRIPAEERYILVACSRRGDQVTFSNRVDRLPELYGSDGRPVAFTWDDVARPRFDMQESFRLMNLLCHGRNAAATIPRASWSRTTSRICSASKARVSADRP